MLEEILPVLYFGHFFLYNQRDINKNKSKKCKEKTEM